MPSSPNPQIDPAKIAAEAEAKKKAGEKPLEVDSPSAKFLRSVIGASPDKPEPKKKPPEGEGESEEPKHKPAPKKRVAAPAPTAIDEAKLGAAIGRSLAEHSKGEGRTKPDDKKEEKPAPSAQEQSDARRITVLERMEVANPERYKGLAGRYKASRETLNNRVAAWEKDHPGESYADMLAAYEKNPDAHPEFEEEAKFTDDLDAQADWDDEDYTRAMMKTMAAEEVSESLKQREAKLDERISEVERAEKRRNAQQELVHIAHAAGNDLWKELGEGFAEMVNEDGTINKQYEAQMQTEDPIKYDVVVGQAKQAEIGAMLIHSLATRLENNDLNNPDHAVINKFCYDMEQKMLGRDPEKNLDDRGRQFCTAMQYSAMTPEQQARHWKFSESDMRGMWMLDKAKTAKKILQAEDEKFARRAKARGLIRDGEETTARTKLKPMPRGGGTDDDERETGSEADGKPVSPAFALSPKTSAGKGAGRAGNENAVTRFVRDVFA